MKITISGSLGNIGKPLATKLISSGHEVTIISSNKDRIKAIETLGAKAAIGSVNDSDFLSEAFAGADAVFAMTPPNMGGSNIITNTTNAGKAFSTAIKKAAVKRVVMLSSIGAELPYGNGPVAGLHNIEKIYETLEEISLTYLRAGIFFTNLYNDISMIKSAGIIGSNYQSTAQIPFSHPEDIAGAAVEELERTTLGSNIHYIISDVRTPGDVAQILGQEIGKPELPWIEFTDEQALYGMQQAGLPDEIAELYVEMGSSIRNGNLSEDFFNNHNNVDGKIKLEDFAKEFAKKF
ncbi:NAD(P)H-binding protein [Epilithonimonas sp. UC225_85]|uniref:NAD(P)H-binding protein n=1 Tax=Epilithonimonas sp. UC225_85 TaxID=3350167 RepID=UPI0036D36026